MRVKHGLAENEMKKTRENIEKNMWIGIHWRFMNFQKMKV